MIHSGRRQRAVPVLPGCVGSRHFICAFEMLGEETASLLRFHYPRAEHAASPCAGARKTSVEPANVFGWSVGFSVFTTSSRSATTAGNGLPGSTYVHSTTGPFRNAKRFGLSAKPSVCRRNGICTLTVSPLCQVRLSGSHEPG